MIVEFVYQVLLHVIAMGYTANGTNIYTSWLMYTTSGDTLMQCPIPYCDEEYCC